MTESTQDHIYHNQQYLILPNFIPHFFCSYLKECSDNIDSSLYGNHVCFDTFMKMSTDLIVGATARPLVPKNTRLQIYTNNDCILPEKKENSNEHTVTVFLGGDYTEIWPIWLINKKIHQQPVLCPLQRGDALVYNSDEIYVWRDHFMGNSHYQLYMYYDGLSNDQ